MSKGSRDRTADKARFDESYDKIFGKKIDWEKVQIVPEEFLVEEESPTLGRIVKRNIIW